MVFPIDPRVVTKCPLTDAKVVIKNIPSNVNVNCIGVYLLFFYIFNRKR